MLVLTILSLVAGIGGSIFSYFQWKSLSPRLTLNQTWLIILILSAVFVVFVSGAAAGLNLFHMANKSAA